MDTRVEDQYSDVLQNIEYAIVTVYEGDRRLADRDVLAAIDALLRTYTSEGANREAVAVGPPGRARAAYEQCRRICEWRLGRTRLNDGDPGDAGPQPGELSVAEVILCLKRIRKSVRLWHAHAGHQGYLDYVSRFLDDAPYDVDMDL